MPKPAPSQYAPPPVLRAKVPWDHSAGTMAFSAPASMKKTPEPISECPHLRRFHTNHKACVTNHGHRNYSIWKETKKAPLAPWSLSMERTKPLCECRAAANGRRPFPPVTRPCVNAQSAPCVEYLARGVFLAPRRAIFRRDFYFLHNMIGDVVIHRIGHDLSMRPQGNHPRSKIELIALHATIAKH